VALVLEPVGGPSALAIELGGIVPDRLADRPLEEIARSTVLADGRPAELGQLFRVGGSCADGRIECVGDFSRVHRVAAGMAWGEILVRGSVGRHAGEGMAGGRLDVEGDAGDWLAAEMTGGTVQVGGRAGDNVAAALPGSEAGMRGGLVVIAGDAGHLAAARMRRGLLAIGGSCGEAAAFELRAGTVLVAGDVGRRSGMGMRRGSLVAGGPAPEVPPTFRRGAAWAPTFLQLLAGRLRQLGFGPAGRDGGGFLAGIWQQWHGDLLTGGRGEIFHRLAS
jgi:formylmethanofuran dehydrogenase subunit C